MEITIIQKKGYLFDEKEVIKLRHCIDYLHHRLLKDDLNEFLNTLRPFVDEMRIKLPNAPTE